MGTEWLKLVIALIADGIYEPNAKPSQPSAIQQYGDGNGAVRIPTGHLANERNVCTAESVVVCSNWWLDANAAASNKQLTHWQPDASQQHS